MSPYSAAWLLMAVSFGIVGALCAVAALVQWACSRPWRSAPRRRSGLGERWERHQSERFGFSSRTRALLPLAFALALCGCPLPQGPNGAPPADAPGPAWERLESLPGGTRVYRTPTPGGWLVMANDGYSGATAAAFVPDPDGAWLRPAPEAAR